jgi:hypothetical protein
MMQTVQKKKGSHRVEDFRTPSYGESSTRKEETGAENAMPLRVHLALQEGADSLTGDDLLKISEIAERAGAVLHISKGSWQIFIGVPAERKREVEVDLQALGHGDVRIVYPVDEKLTFRLARTA